MTFFPGVMENLSIITPLRQAMEAGSVILWTLNIKYYLEQPGMAKVSHQVDSTYLGDHKGQGDAGRVTLHPGTMLDAVTGTAPNGSWNSKVVPGPQEQAHYLYSASPLLVIHQGSHQEGVGGDLGWVEGCCDLRPTVLEWPCRGSRGHNWLLGLTLGCHCGYGWAAVTH